MLAHGDGHGDGGHRVLLRALGGRVAEEHHHRVADELVDGAAEFQGDLRHLVQVGVEQVGQRLGFQLLGQLGEALDVGEEHRQLLALGFQAHALAAAEDRLPHLRRQVLGEVVRQPRGLFLFAGDRLLGLGQAQPLLVDEVGDDADVQPREQDADQRHQHRRLALEAGHGQRPGEHRGAQRDQQDQAERAQAAEHQRGKGQHQNQHQAGHHRIAEQRRAGAGMHGVDVEQQLAGAVGVFGLEAAAQVVGQVRVEQGVRDHPEDLVAEVAAQGARGDAGGDGDVGQHAGMVLTQGYSDIGAARLFRDDGLHALNIPVACWQSRTCDSKNLNQAPAGEPAGRRRNHDGCASGVLRGLDEQRERLRPSLVQAAL
ncbi:hypothetical protein FQZ97_722660 [compost metagenome]